MKRYWNLLVWDTSLNRWTVQFGDPQKGIVEAELRDWNRCGTRLSCLKIKSSKPDQESINEMLDKMNEIPSAKTT